MNPLRLLVIAGLCITTTLVTAAQERIPIQLPSDPSTPVITMDRRGGFTSPRKNSNPVLTIRADGRVTVIDPSGRSEYKDAMLSPGEIQDLLHFAITEQDFFAFDASDVQRAIRAEFASTGRGTVVSDASDTVLRIRTADREQEASYNALSFLAERNPGIKALVQLRAIELKLQRLEEIVRAGGKTEIAAALDRANAYLKDKYPSMPPLTSNDYLRTLESVTGGQSIQFSRSIPGDPTSVSVTVRYPPSGPPQITSD